MRATKMNGGEAFGNVGESSTNLGVGPSADAGVGAEEPLFEGFSNNPETQESFALPPTKRWNTSKAWDYFEELPLDVDGKARAKCKFCSKVYLSGGIIGTSNMNKHYKNHHASQSHTSLRPSKFDPRVFRELFDKTIIRHNLPFELADYEGLRIALRYANPKIEFFSRNTAKSDVIKIHNHEKVKIKKLLELVPGRISLTSDLWKALIDEGYISLTAHFIDNDWKLKKKVLNFRFMPSPHGGIAICEKTYCLLLEWGIEKKIFSMTLDNSSLRLLILSMIAQDVLAIPLTTVVSELAFSVGSSVIDKWRSALSHESVEALICTQDWLYGKIEDLAPELDDLVHVVLA